MKKIFSVILLGAAFCVAQNVFLAPAHARSQSPTLEELSKKHTRHKSSSHHRKHTKKHSKGKLGEQTRVRSAQINLAQLGYNPGPSDGIMGSRTRSAIKAFQRDHHLHASGKLTPETYDRIMQETGSQNPRRNSAAPPENFYATHPDYYGYYGSDYANPTAFGSPQMIPSRFGSLELNDQMNGSAHQYALLLNGQPVFRADNQPSVINVSRTFNLQNADALVLTSYGAGDSQCPYRHYLLVVRANSNGLHPINNCTRNYEAYSENGNLLISFPGNRANSWSSGDTWRYESGLLTKL